MNHVLAYGIEIAYSGRSKTFGNFRRSDNCTDRMSIAHWFGHSHNIWDDLVRLKGPVVSSNATEANLNLIGNRNTSGIANDSAIKTQISKIYQRLGQTIQLTCTPS